MVIKKDTILFIPNPSHYPPDCSQKINVQLNISWTRWESLRDTRMLVD